MHSKQLRGFVVVGFWVALGTVGACASPYEKWVKSMEASFPRPLPAGETVNDWWPLADGTKYVYAREKGGDQPETSENEDRFTLTVHRENKEPDLVRFTVDGMDDFPYSGLRIEGNRLSLPGKYDPDRLEPFLVFPLFDGLLYADEKIEYEFLRNTITQTSDNGFYAPVETSLLRAEDMGGGRYRIRRIGARGAVIGVFEKGRGMVEWRLEGAGVAILQDGTGDEVGE